MRPAHHRPVAAPADDRCPAHPLGVGVGSHPSRADAARAINDLFYTERFQPTPAEIIERALGLSGIMDSEWRSILARLAGSENTPSQGAIAALRAAGSSLSGLRGATEQHMDTVHRRWEAERRFALLAVARRSNGKKLTRTQG